MKKRIAIIGASYFQEKLIVRAKEMGLETHVFAWKTGAVGEKLADFFYPISIREKEEILQKCQELNIDGITSIGSDLAMVTVNYVAEEMGLVGNSVEATFRSTNKHEMRKAFETNGDPSPKSILVDETTDIEKLLVDYPIIVKPTDRSGSRGINKLYSKEGLRDAIAIAIEQSFEKKALVEEYATGDEYSIEYISCNGKHYFLSVTQKSTTGDPHYVETGHIEPAALSDDVVFQIQTVVCHALDTLGIKNGASHSEIKIAENGKIAIIEIGGRMGGDYIGSDLVELSTRYDFVRGVIQIAMGETFEEPHITETRPVSVRFILNNEDIEDFNKLKEEYPERIVRADIPETIVEEAVDSATRSGYYIFRMD